MSQHNVTQNHNDTSMRQFKFSIEYGGNTEEYLPLTTTSELAHLMTVDYVYAKYGNTQAAITYLGELIDNELHNPQDTVQ